MSHISLSSYLLLALATSMLVTGYQGGCRESFKHLGDYCFHAETRQTKCIYLGPGKQYREASYKDIYTILNGTGTTKQKIYDCDDKKAVKAHCLRGCEQYVFRTQASASEYCQGLNATLPYPVWSLSGWQYAARLAEDAKFGNESLDTKKPIGFAWTGATKNGSSWTWPDGRPFEEELWGPYQPNGPRSECAYLGWYLGSLSDWHCNKTSITLCQAPGPPSPCGIGCIIGIVVPALILLVLGVVVFIFREKIFNKIKGYNIEQNEQNVDADSTSTDPEV